MANKAAFDFKKYVEGHRLLVEEKLSAYLHESNDPELLWEAMRYSALSQGKRLRALLALASFEAVKNNNGQAIDLEPALPLAAAIEFVHAMSLIHDDLPALDNDDYRRGRLTNHKVFGEAMALLAGDALLIYAFEIILEKTDTQIHRGRLCHLALGLAKAVGAYGMVGGQVVDMQLTGTFSLPSGAPITVGPKTIDQNLIESIHKRKTGALIAYSSWSGAYLAGADNNQVAAFKQFGEIIGLAFQIADDLLDVTGDIKTLGKTPGKDAKDNKVTWVTILGLDEAKAELNRLQKVAEKALLETGINEEFLAAHKALLQFAINRTN